MFDPLILRILTLLAILTDAIFWVIVPFPKTKDMYKPRSTASSSSWHDPTRGWTVFRDALIVLSLMLVLSVLLVPEYLLNSSLEINFPYDELVQGSGFVLLILGAILGGLAIRTLGMFATERIELKKDHQLVENGPYRYARHPIYGASLLVGFGFFFLELNLAFLILTIPIFLVDMYRARVEERLLMSPEAFGNRYREYAKRTKRFIPCLF